MPKTLSKNIPVISSAMEGISIARSIYGKILFLPSGFLKNKPPSLGVPIKQYIARIVKP